MNPQSKFKASRFSFGQVLACPVCSKQVSVFVEVDNGEKFATVTRHERPLCLPKPAYNAFPSEYQTMLWDEIDKIWSVPKGNPAT